MPIGKWLRKASTRYLRRNGFHVSVDRCEARLRQRNFKIASLIDVGVYEGSPDFYELFPDSRIVMIDPLPDLRERAKKWIEARNACVIQSAAGAAEATLPLRIAGPYTGLLPRLDRRSDSATTEIVRVAPLDTLLAENRIAGPFGIKIDTEGYERDVIAGATETLKVSTFVFAEVNIRARFEGSYSFSEFITLMGQHGFEVAEILPKPHHGRHADVLFIRAGL